MIGLITTTLHPPLYLITDRHQTLGRPLTWVIAKALAGGVKLVQLREKDLPTRELLSLARTLRQQTAECQARLLINDRIDICLAVGADGVHLPAQSLPTGVVRKILGPDRLIGVSTHSAQEAKAAEREGADFVTIGPVFETPAKLRYGPPLGLDIIRQACAEVHLPVFAIGGVQKKRIAQIIEAGADGVALISAIIGASDPEKAANELISELGRGLR